MLRSVNQIRASAATIKITVAPIVPVRKATSGDLREVLLTSWIPANEQRIPTDASARGRNISLLWSPPASDPIKSADNVDAIAIVAIIAPQ